MAHTNARIERKCAWALALAVAAFTPALAQPKAPENFSIAAAGDIIYVRPALKTLEHTSPSLLKVLRSADVSFGNFEGNVFALNGFEGALQAPIDGPNLLSSPPVAREIRALGFKLVSHANNHAFDWGAEGIKATDRNLTAAGLAHAGSGTSLRAARAPGYVMAHGVKVGLVAATSSFPEAAPAADGWGPLPARAGVNPLHVQKRAPTTSGVSYRMDDTDLGALTRSVAQARAASGLVVFSLHTHDAGALPGEPTDFEIELAHKMIDAGADLFVAHGPHQLRGIEIYKGRPIFYSLANFAIMQPDVKINPKPLVIAPGSFFTQRVFFESVIAVGSWRRGELVEVRLYPFELADTGKAETHGLPRPVSDAAGRAIIERLATLSRPFGTDIRYEQGVGVIRLDR